MPKIRQIAIDAPQLTLAVSLHAPNDNARSSIMPVNRRYPIQELVGACRDYVKTTGRRITFEVALISGQNDRLVVGEYTAATSCCFLLLPITPSVSCSCLDALNTRSSRLPPSPAVSHCLPLSTTRLSLLLNRHPQS